MNYMEFMDFELPIAAAIIKLGDEWIVERANDEFASMVGYSTEELTNCKGEQLILKKDRYVLEETLEQTVRLHEVASQEVRIVRKNQEVRWVEARCSLINYVNAIPRLMLFMWDIDAQKTSHLEQRLLNKKYEAMENMSQEFPFDVDVTNQTMLRTHRFMEKFGEINERDSYCPISEIAHYVLEEDQDIFYKAIQEASKTEKTGNFDVRFNVAPKAEKSNYVWFRTFYKSVTDDEGNIIRIIGRSFNVDQDKHLQEEIKKDPLTKLLNKIEIQQSVTRFLEDNNKESHAMLLIDIDNFKGINDNFGHTFGDTVIVEVAQAIKSLFRGDDIIGRVGGDEFLVFMKNTTLERATERAKKMCEVLNKTYSGKQIDYHISSSIGISMYPIDGRTYGALFEKADHAMYRAKESGKNTFEIANANDTGRIQSVTKTVDRRMGISQSEQEFLGYMVSVMTHAKNPEASMNMLLKRIAERYDLNFVAIFEDDAEKKRAIITNYYHPDVVLPNNLAIPMSEKRIAELPVGECVILNSEGMDRSMLHDKCEAYIDALRGGKDNSVAICRFLFAQEHLGSIFFSSSDAHRQWTRTELEVLQEISRTISVFITLRFRLYESREKIRHLKRRDMLTDLYNQDAFRQVVSRKIKEKEPGKVLALEYFDINNFGYVNDNYGYKVGDNILRLLADDLKKQPYFVAGCRLYSDFFLVLVQDESKEALEANIRARSRRFSNMQNHKYPNSSMGVTAGLYIIENERVDIELAIENATLAWKNTKKKNKDMLEFFDDSLRANRSEEQQVIGEFFEALYRDDFRMYLQPKFKLGTREIYGAEALARWRRPDGQVLTPAAFIDSLEKIGYIKELDFYIFEEVLKTMDMWRRKKIEPIVISTNFSGHHFEGESQDFINRISHILSKYQVDPEFVEIEVTESVFVENLEGLLDCLQKLREMGFRVAIDDFGTGYSSLSMLADVPADVVKIDKSFINKNMTDKKRRLLYEIGNMVRILDKDIIVEGVETEEQENYLKDGGFTCGQGYLCNKPIPITEFEKLYM